MGNLGRKDVALVLGRENTSAKVEPVRSQSRKLSDRGRLTHGVGTVPAALIADWQSGRFRQ